MNRGSQVHRADLRASTSIKDVFAEITEGDEHLTGGEGALIAGTKSGPKSVAGTSSPARTKAKILSVTEAGPLFRSPSVDPAHSEPEIEKLKLKCAFTSDTVACFA